MSAWSEIFAETLVVEGKYSNNPNDRGGATKYGITEKMARKHGFQGDMKDLPLDLAEKIGKAEFWDVINGDALAAISLKIAKELFDTGYNMGPGTAGTFLQRSLNAFNKQGRAFQDLIVDHSIGAGTLAALKRFLELRGPEGEVVLLRALNCLQGARYIGIAEADARQEEFAYGWILNRVQV